MIGLRSAMFNAFFFTLHVALVIGMLVLLPFPRRWMQSTVGLWTVVLRNGLKVIIGLGSDIRGLENRPDGPAVYACKHQSAWDTFAFYVLVGDPNYVLKAELMRIPVWGWHARKAGAISVDREGGGGALRKLVRDTRARLQRGSQVIVFPEGTRTQPGARHPYNPGIAAIAAVAAEMDVPVVPVAVNSGLFWGRRSFIKYPGAISLEFLEPMPRGLPRKAFMAELEQRIETATDRLVAEARARYPRLAPVAAAARDNPGSGPVETGG